MEKFKYANKKLKIKDWVLDEENGQKLAGKTFIAEDYWINLTGKSWLDTDLGNPAVFMYAIRSMREKLPEDDYVIYGKVGLFGHLLHITELEINERK